MALLEAFRSAMSQLGLSGKLHVTDITSSSAAFHRADEGIVAPAVRSDEYVPALLEIVRSRRISLLVPLTDLDLLCLSREQGQFDRLGCTVMIGPEPAIALCRDKAQTDELLKRAGLARIETLTLDDFRRRPFYPCFVKPISGSGSIGSGVVRDERELVAHVATFGELMVVQEYVTGQEFTVDVYRSRDGEVRCVVPRQRLLVRSGEVEKGLTVNDPRIIAAASRLVGMLDGLWGVVCCQCRRDHEGQLRFFEINPRFGGGAPLSIAAGANLPLYLLQEVLGLPITARIGDFTDHLLMMRYHEAVFTQVEDPESLEGYAKPLFR